MATVEELFAIYSPPNDGERGIRDTVAAFGDKRLCP